MNTKHSTRYALDYLQKITGDKVHTHIDILISHAKTFKFFYTCLAVVQVISSFIFFLTLALFPISNTFNLTCMIGGAFFIFMGFFCFRRSFKIKRSISTLKEGDPYA